MDCNKEEAVRAKQLAEKKMQSKDFIAARKVALRAQQLFPDLENISQILTVCEVHCSAEAKINGEMDWYGILQIQTTADESSIKKQYRKLALALHPDKNQFAGAEAAFKLIGEAQMTLLDQAKRHLYDVKRNATVKTIPPRQPAQQARNSRSNFSTVNFNGLNQQQQQQQQQSSFAAAQTFWTMCPFCGMRYQYYRSILNKSLRCQNCLKPFVAHDLTAKAVPSGVNSDQQWTNTGIPTYQVPVPQTNNVNHQSRHGSMSSGTRFKPNASGMSGINSEQRSGNANRSTDAKNNSNGCAANEVKFTKVDSAKVDQGKRAAKFSNTSSGQKRGRKIVIDSSDSDSLDSDNGDVEEDVPFEMRYESTSTSTRRSSRRKQTVMYNESEDEDDLAYPPGKRSRNDTTTMASDKNSGKEEKNMLHEEKLSNGIKKVKEDVMQGIKEGTSEKGKSELGTGSGSGTGTGQGLENLVDQQHTYNYPDPEFCDFEESRDASKFKVDQIWAIYDNVDGMPRFYARIRKIDNLNFCVRFTWLEHNPASEVEMEWSEAGLPVACGNYWLGNSESSKDRLMFSHVVAWEKGKRKNSYDIYPKAGEVWALFKNWNISWSSVADSHRDYEYDVVEVISNFEEGSGVIVNPLVKIEGFVSLFIGAKEASFVIPPNEILKFSHNVPSHILTETERKDLPHGCLELDCASLPTNFLEVFPSVGLDAFVGSANMTDGTKEPCSQRKDTDSGKSEELHSCKGSNVIDLESNQANNGDSHHPEVQNHVPWSAHQSAVHGSEKHNENNGSGSEGSSEKDVDVDSLSPEPESPITFELPETEFHNFDDDKRIEIFEQGQIWALYSDADQHPNYYGYITRVSIEKCRVYIKWLECCCHQEEEKRWSIENIPISCGIFKVTRQTMSFPNTGTFSHRVEAEPNARGQYEILPKVKEIWAVYKNWRVGWKFSDFDCCEYEVVEVFEHSGTSMKVNILTKVDGYRAVFCRGRDGIDACTMVIPAREYLRFAYRIPAFLLTNERGGKLMGCWELDTASVPEVLLFSSSN